MSLVFLYFVDELVMSAILLPFGQRRLKVDTVVTFSFMLGAAFYTVSRNSLDIKIPIVWKLSLSPFPNIERRPISQQLEYYRLIMNDEFVIHQEFAGEDDVDKLIQEFTRREEENYALFNYINEVCTELKNLSDNVKMLRVNIGMNIIIGERLECQTLTGNYRY